MCWPSTSRVVNAAKARCVPMAWSSAVTFWAANCAGGAEALIEASAGNGAGPRVAILAEYDALPGVGHACGHNLIAAGAVGAFVAAAAVAGGLGGEVVLLGTPAEEGGGGKIAMIKAGAFDGVAAA